MGDAESGPAQLSLSQRLAAILAADAVGYSRLMSSDERATVAALDAARAVFRGQITSNRGRVVDTAGDSVLAVLDTATGAVVAALAIQDELSRRSAEISDDSRLLFRIGVHLGDVIEKPDGTVYGEGVNIAARLQTLAEPGGVTVSESVRAAVRGKVATAFEDQGVQLLKNIPDGVRVYRLRRDADSTLSARGTQERLSAPDRPSIAVLPFTIMSGDLDQQYFADGIVEDIITELSRFERLFVIARNTSFTYRSQSVDVRKVAAELGVHFVLEGSVRKAGDRVRISAQLIDGDTGEHVWAERYEDVLSDVFELQERITRQVVSAMVPEIYAAEMRSLERGRRRFTEADDLAWRAQKAVTDGIFKGQPDLCRDAIRLAGQAVDREPGCVLGWSVLAQGHSVLVFFGWTQDRRGSVEAGRQAADAMLELAPKDSQSYHARALMGMVSGDHTQAVADERRAYELNPNNAVVLFFLSWLEAAQGNVERAKALAANAIRTSPKDRWLGTAHLAYAMCAFIEQDFGELRKWAELAIQSHPTAPIRRALMIAYAAETGDAALLRTHLEKLQTFAPDFIPSMVRGDYRPFLRLEHMAMFLSSLRKAEPSGTT